MFGERSAALRRIDETEARKMMHEVRRSRGELALVTVGRLPASRQGQPSAVYSPGADVRTGAANGNCAGPADDPPGNLQLPCDGLDATQPRPAGSGDVTVNAAGVNTATISTVLPATVIDYGINDPSGVLLVTAITAGDTNLIVGGSIRTATWQSAKTACPIQKPFGIYPWSGLVFAFSNTTNQNITVNCWALLRVRRC